MAAKNKTTSAPKIKPPKAPASSKPAKQAKASKKSKAAHDDTELVAARATIKKLKSTVAALEKNVAKLEKKTSELKAEAKKLRATASASVKKAKDDGSKKVKQTVEAVVRHDAPAEEPVETAPVETAAPADSALPAEPAQAASAPASERTVAQLRAAARQQGVPGYSRMRKDQLIAALA